MFSKFSVRRPYTVLVGVIIALVLGFLSFSKMSMDFLPSMEMPYCIVMTSYPGASPEEVETVVTAPVEAAMAKINNVKNMRSMSSLMKSGLTSSLTAMYRPLHCPSVSMPELIR